MVRDIIHTIMVLKCACLDKHRNKLREMEGIAPLVSLLKCEDEKVAKNAAIALGNACLENGITDILMKILKLKSEENQRVAEKLGASETLVELVKSHNKKSEELRHCASMVLVNIVTYRGIHLYLFKISKIY